MSRGGVLRWLRMMYRAITGLGVEGPSTLLGAAARPNNTFVLQSCL